MRNVCIRMLVLVTLATGLIAATSDAGAQEYPLPEQPTVTLPPPSCRFR